MATTISKTDLPNNPGHHYAMCPECGAVVEYDRWDVRGYLEEYYIICPEKDCWDDIPVKKPF